MSRKLKLTLACGDYEIVRALKEGSVQPDGIELTVLTGWTRPAALAHAAQPGIRRLGNVLFVLPVGRDQGLPLHPRLSAPPLPPWLHLRQHEKGIRKPTDLNAQADQA